MNLLVARLGDEAAARVIAKAGGERLAIPSELANGRGKPLERRFGAHLATLIVLHFGGQTIDIPTAGPGLHVATRDVARLHNRGLSASKIARKLRCTVRTVQSHRHKARAAGLIE